MRESSTPDATDWKFKAYKQIVKINYNAQNYDDALAALEQMAESFSQVNSNYAEDSITRMINNYSTSNNQDYVFRFYDIIANRILATSSLPNRDKIWLKVGISKLNALLDAQNFHAGKEFLDSIALFMRERPESIRKTYALDFIAAEIALQIYDNPQNIVKLGKLYAKSVRASNVVTHPRVLGQIQECGGIILFYQGNYEKARLQFYESFNNYDEMGSCSKRKVLQYLALCSILTSNELNPFVLPETRVYAELPEFRNILLMIQACDNFSVSEYLAVMEKIRHEQDILLQDSIFRDAAAAILSNLRRLVTKRFLRVYKRLKFTSLMEALCFSSCNDLKSLLRDLAFSGGLDGTHIDHVEGVLVSCDPQQPFLRLDVSPVDFYRSLQVDCAIAFPLVTELLRSTVDASVSHEPGQVQPSLALEDFALHQLVYVSRPSPTDDMWTLEIANLLNVLYSALPDPLKRQVSQKDQIESKQRIESSNGAGQGDFKAFVDSGKQGVAESDEESDDEQAVTVRKVDLLRSWCSALEERF